MTPPEPQPRFDLAVIGAGAAGLFAAIFAGRTARHAARPLRIIALDGAKKLGAKILVAGGGRCNVTHHAVDESAYAGASRHAIKKVLRRFDVPQTVAFFRDLGVELKREDTGKLFPVSDDAHSVLDALLHAATDAGVMLAHPWRVAAIERTTEGFRITRDAAATPTELPTLPAQHLTARRVILAAGGMALPKTGSDGLGYALARALGHSTTPRIFPALVPITIDRSSFIPALSGLTLPATLRVVSSTGKHLAEFTNSTLLTHFGLSGPSVLDISRYFADALAIDPGARLLINWLPGTSTELLDAELIRLGPVSPIRAFANRLPERLVRAICESINIEPTLPASSLTRDRRRALAAAFTAMPLPVTGDRGFTYAEVTAGGIPLSEIRLETMESRPCPGLHLCGEICDVDGRIGGFNFQWAWASGYVAGLSAAQALTSPDTPHT